MSRLLTVPSQISDGRTEYRLGAIDSKDYPDIDLSQDAPYLKLR